MKITNIVLAAMMIVAAPTFANTAVKVTTGAVEAAVARLSSTQAQTTARSLGLAQNAKTSEIAAAVVKAIADKKMSASSIVDKSGAVSVNPLMAAVNASAQTKMPGSGKVEGDGGVVITDAADQRAGNRPSHEPVRGDEATDSLDALLNRCSADGSPNVINAACDKLNDSASKATWATLSKEIVANAKAAGLSTASAVKANLARWSQIVNKTIQDRFQVSCANANERALGLHQAGGCQLLGAYSAVRCN